MEDANLMHITYAIQIIILIVVTGLAYMRRKTVKTADERKHCLIRNVLLIIGWILAVVVAAIAHLANTRLVYEVNEIFNAVTSVVIFMHLFTLLARQLEDTPNNQKLKIYKNLCLVAIAYTVCTTGFQLFSK